MLCSVSIHRPASLVFGQRGNRNTYKSQSCISHSCRGTPQGEKSRYLRSRHGNLSVPVPCSVLWFWKVGSPCLRSSSLEGCIECIKSFAMVPSFTSDSVVTKASRNVFDRVLRAGCAFLVQGMEGEIARCALHCKAFFFFLSLLGD